MANRIHTTQRDLLTGAPLGITTDHNYIHRGKAFTVSAKSGSVAAGASYIIYFKTPSTGKYIHLRPTSISTTANIVELTIAKDAVLSGTTGTATTPINRNHLSSLTSQSTVKLGATLSNAGTVNYYTTAGSGGGVQSRSGGNGPGENNEIVLDQDTVYAFTATNIGASDATVIYIDLFWYEEDEGLINGS
jgi:hypothetical protein